MNKIIGICIVVLLCLMALFLWLSNIKPAKAQTNFVNYLPIVMLKSQPIKGLGITAWFPEDFQTLNIDWFYTWGNCPVNTGALPICIIMSRNGDDPLLPFDYSGFVLLFNEPSNEEPYGHPIDPFIAVDIYQAFVAKYPNVKWVIGNDAYVGWGKWWLEAFANIIHNIDPAPDPYAYGVHTYMECTPGYENTTCRDFLIEQLEYIHNFTGRPLWITEFAEIKGNVAMDDVFTTVFKSKPYIERWAYFTNRYTPGNNYIPPELTSPLVIYETGVLTAVGEWYRDD